MTARRYAAVCVPVGSMRVGGPDVAPPRPGEWRRARRSRATVEIEPTGAYMEPVLPGSLHSGRGVVGRGPGDGSAWPRREQPHVRRPAADERATGVRATFSDPGPGSTSVLVRADRSPAFCRSELTHEALVEDRNLGTSEPSSFQRFLTQSPFRPPRPRPLAPCPSACSTPPTTASACCWWSPCASCATRSWRSMRPRRRWRRPLARLTLDEHVMSVVRRLEREAPPPERRSRVAASELVVGVEAEVGDRNGP